MSDLRSPLALYVHWPFCLSKCPYCDFNSHVASNINHDLWLSSYIKELEYFRPEIEKRQINTIFFGGGTPSLMNPSTIEGILRWVKENAYCSPFLEISMEANPTSVETQKLRDFHAAGVNRISIGIQSLIPGDLKALGRTHSVDCATAALSAASKIFDRYSFDLIYAREGQNLKSWQNELKQAALLANGHISLYQLTIERGTPFFALHRDGELILPENDLAADMYLWTKEYLVSLGYKRYEISNFAKEGQECRHNMAYWNYDEYLGIGPGAHSRICLSGSKSPVALMNYHQPDKWLNLIQECGSAIQSNQMLTPKEVIEEILMMGLRLEDGITDRKLVQYLDISFEKVLNIHAIETLMKSGYLKYEGRNLKLTDNGLLMHSYIVPRILQ